MDKKEERNHENDGYLGMLRRILYSRTTEERFDSIPFIMNEERMSGTKRDSGKKVKCEEREK